MSQYDKFMQYFEKQANDNDTLVQQLLREYEANDRELRDSHADRDWLKRLARM